MTENVAKLVHGNMITDRYYNLIKTQQKHKETKSGEEIVADIVARAGLELA